MQPRRRPLSLLRTTAPIALSLAIAHAAPAASAEHSEEQLVRHFLTGQLAAPDRQIEIETFAPNAQMPSCRDPQPFLPQPLQARSGRVVVGVRCSDASPRYVQAKVTIRAPYPVSIRALSKDEVLRADMFEMRVDDLGKLPRNAILAPHEAVGRQLTRTLPAGSPLTSNALRAVPAVARGAPVRVEARTSGFVASREGTALDAGGLGETIRVRTDGGPVIKARISGPNLLEVDF
jgi:flagella basal body P-ring formation protein FlgA